MILWILALAATANLRRKMNNTCKNSKKYSNQQTNLKTRRRARSVWRCLCHDPNRLTLIFLKLWNEKAYKTLTSKFVALGTRKRKKASGQVRKLAQIRPVHQALQIAQVTNEVSHWTGKLRVKRGNKMMLFRKGQQRAPRALRNQVASQAPTILKVRCSL
jgi:hypothetical protein